MKKIRKTLSALLAASMLLTSAVSTASASAAENTFKTVALGDSITTGYSVNDIYRIPYAEIVSCYYGGTLENFAENGMTTGGLLENLKNPAVQQAVAQANLVLVTIGANDILQPALRNEYIDSSSYSSLSEMISDLRQKSDANPLLQLKINMYLDKTMPENITSGRANIAEIASQIRALNPSAKIVFQTVYNPLDMIDDNTSFASSGTIEVLRAHVQKYLEGIPDNTIYAYGINDAIRDLKGVQVADVADSYEALLRHAFYYTEISKVDVHPNGIGHMALAQAVIDTIGKNEDGYGLYMRQAYKGTNAAATLGNISADMNSAIVQTALQNTLGDVDCDGKVDISDAAETLNHYAMQAAGGEAVLTGLDAVAADVDNDSAVTIQDASVMLDYYAQCAAGLDCSFQAFITK